MHPKPKRKAPIELPVAVDSYSSDIHMSDNTQLHARLDITTAIAQEAIAPPGRCQMRLADV
jgi:hypothetical protein